MKNIAIFYLLIITLFTIKATAQMNKYSFEWQTIDKALQKGLTTNS